MTRPLHCFRAIADADESGFMHCKPDEVVMFGLACGLGRYGNCGCQRSWTGIETLKAATLAEVTLLPEDIEVTDEIEDVVDVATELPLGIWVRPRYNYIEHEWTWRIVGPN